MAPLTVELGTSTTSSATAVAARTKAANAARPGYRAPGWDSDVRVLESRSSSRPRWSVPAFYLICWSSAVYLALISGEPTVAESRMTLASVFLASAALPSL